MKTSKINIWHKAAEYSCCLFLGIILVLFFPMNVKAEPDYGKEIIMVSMGDSYSSGEGIPPFYGPWAIENKVKDEDWLAHRSKKSWPGRLRLNGLDKEMKEYRVNPKKKKDSQGNSGKWYFVASSGAITTNIFQEGQNKPYKRIIGQYVYKKDNNPLPKQAEIFDRITKDEVDYITLSLGGNDVGFSTIVESCAMNVPYTEQNGLPNLINKAWDDFNEGNDPISEKLYNVYNDLWTKIGKKGTIIVAGYPQLLDPEGGKIIFKLGFDQTDAARINEEVSKFNDAIEQVVLRVKKEKDVNIYFVSVEDAFIGHGAYADEPYINKVMCPSTTEDLKDDLKSAYSIHPNEKGAAAYASCVQEMIDWIEAGKPSITVSGQVIDKNDQPVGDLTVVIETEKAKKEVFRGTTDENGEFSGDIKLTTQKLRIVVSNEEGFLIDTSVTKPIEYGNNDLGKIKLNEYEGTKVVSQTEFFANDNTTSADVSADDSAQSSEKANCLELYAELLEELSDTAITPSRLVFQLIYLNDDEIPELVVTDGGTVESQARLYSFREGRVNQIFCNGGDWGNHGSLYYVEREGIALDAFTTVFSGNYAFYRIENGQATFIKEFSKKPSTGGSEYSFYIGGNPASQEEYEKQYGDCGGSRLSAAGYNYGTVVSQESIQLLLRNDPICYRGEGGPF